MSKKLEGNGLFESSRMMLPEHKEAYLLHQQTLNKKTRPQLDDQEMEYIFRCLGESIQFKTCITLILFEEYDEIEVAGTVIQIDQQRQAVKLTFNNDFMWIHVADIVKIISYDHSTSE
ncbi:YolD-like family protein [Paenibacillus elgii]|uniref:YolD-like family protein n=1 Tax=Paenibacillus elgii TaxID=189691 RepID=UPI0013D6A4EB|nr:YolD-like family protein [Paenibacillus elgii]